MGPSDIPATSSDKWHLDELFVRVQGKLHWLWQVVDQHGHVLDILVQSRCNTSSAKRFLRKQVAA